jgi:hypothetical protein
MMSNRFIPFVPFVLLAVGACGRGDANADAERDLNLPPAESIATLGDTALSQAQPQAEAPAARPQPPRQAAAPAARSQAPSELGAGTTIMLSATDTLELNNDVVGETITATVVEALLDSRGREVIPAGALVYGTLEKTQVTDSTGTTEVMLLRFQQVRIDGTLYAMEARTDSIGSRTARDDVGLGEAAKVGAGAAVGAIAGRLIGGNRTGTLVGAAVGTAAGVGVAMATRGNKVMLDAGAPIRIVLTAPFVRTS